MKGRVGRLPKDDVTQKSSRSDEGSAKSGKVEWLNGVNETF